MNKNLHKFNPAVQRPPGNQIPDAKKNSLGIQIYQNKFSYYKKNHRKTKKK